MSRRVWMLFLAMVLALSTLLPACAQEAEPDELWKTAEEAYIYCYPLVLITASPTAFNRPKPMLKCWMCPLPTVPTATASASMTSLPVRNPTFPGQIPDPG